MKKILKKYGLRLGAGVLVYGFLHLSHCDSIDEFFSSSPINLAMFAYTPIVVVLIWEGTDHVFAYLEARNYNFNNSKDLFKSISLLSLFMVPAVFAASGFSEAFIKPFFDCPTYTGTVYKEVAQGTIFGWLIIAARIIRETSIQNKQLEKDKALVQKELLQSQYQNLKNQINPHFLFNSFSVLQSLIDTDSERASVFLTKLSSMYRYILEKREESMSSLERELEMLDVFMFLLKTRHEESLLLTLNIDSKFHQHFLPTLSLQMLVENAVKHNNFSKDQPLLIEICIKEEYLVVKNAVRRKGAPINSTKIGLENIRNQYELQSDKPMIVLEDEHFFTVKIPVLTRLKLV